MSAVMSDQSNKNVAEFFAPGPGERLRAARLSMGYDLAKLASELHLTSSVVEALEADDYAGVGARVFVRGYLRNYARIVDMPVETILRQFDEKWPDDGGQHTVVRQSPTLPADVGPSRGLAGAVSWLLVIGTLVLFLMWWRGYLDEIVPQEIRSGVVADSDTFAAPAADETPGVLTLDVGSSPADGGLDLPVLPVDPLDGPQDGLNPLPATAGVGQDGLGGLPDDAADNAIAVIESTTVARPPSSAAPQSVRVTTLPSVASPVDDGGAPVFDGTRQIVMTFHGPCWVDVRDAERRFKLFGEMPKGARKVLGGQPPYKMVIGNATAVTISVNGQPFDLRRYAKGNVARFTLDP